MGKMSKRGKLARFFRFGRRDKVADASDGLEMPLIGRWPTPDEKQFVDLMQMKWSLKFVKEPKPSQAGLVLPEVEKGTKPTPLSMHDRYPSFPPSEVGYSTAHITTNSSEMALVGGFDISSTMVGSPVPEPSPLASAVGVSEWSNIDAYNMCYSVPHLNYSRPSRVGYKSEAIYGTHAGARAKAAVANGHNFPRPPVTGPERQKQKQKQMQAQAQASHKLPILPTSSSPDRLPLPIGLSMGGLPDTKNNSAVGDGKQTMTADATTASTGTTVATNTNTATGTSTATATPTATPTATTTATTTATATATTPTLAATSQEGDIFEQITNEKGEPSPGPAAGTEGSQDKKKARTGGDYMNNLKKKLGARLGGLGRKLKPGRGGKDEEKK